MGFVPAGSIAIAVAVGLAAIVTSTFIYLRLDLNETSPETAADQNSPRPPAGAEQTPFDPAVLEEPSFDLVRVTPDGSGLIAGRAVPGARVRLRSGNLALAEAKVGPSGRFAAIFQAEPGEEAQVLELEAQAGDGGVIRSEERILLFPALPRAEESADAMWSEAAGKSMPAPSFEPALAATAVLAPGEPMEVIPALEPSAAGETLNLASIEYGRDGSVRVAGSAPAGSRLRLYVDGNHVIDRLTEAGGRWEASLEGLKERTYRIRVDALGENGDVTGRIETPFQRTFPPPGGDATVTVQPGNNLWTIARTHYGSGLRYTQIFTANSDLIDNPDLIYPGQIFALPEANDQGGGRQSRP